MESRFFPAMNADDVDVTSMRTLSMRVLAHELRAPINAVDGYLDMLRRMWPGGVGNDDGAGDGIAGIASNVAVIFKRCEVRLAGIRMLIDELTTIVRTDTAAGGGTARIGTAAEMRRVASEVAESLHETAEAAGVCVNVETDDREDTCSPDGGTCGATGGELAIVLTNLIGNAIRYGRCGGMVRVTCGDGMVTVWDDGCGMTAVELDHVFDAFARGRREATTAVPGTGLGLWIVRQMVGRSGGSIAVHSEPGTGTEFTLRWPGDADARR